MSSTGKSHPHTKKIHTNALRRQIGIFFLNISKTIIEPQNIIPSHLLLSISDGKWPEQSKLQDNH